MMTGSFTSHDHSSTTKDSNSNDSRRRDPLQTILHADCAPAMIYIDFSGEMCFTQHENYLLAPATSSCQHDTYYHAMHGDGEEVMMMGSLSSLSSNHCTHTVAFLSDEDSIDGKSLDTDDWMDLCCDRLGTLSVSQQNGLVATCSGDIAMHVQEDVSETAARPCTAKSLTHAGKQGPITTSVPVSITSSTEEDVHTVCGS